MHYWRLSLDLKKTFTTGETFRFLKVVIRIDEPVLQTVAGILGKKFTQGSRSELETFVRLNAPVWIANALYLGKFRAVEILDEGPFDGKALEAHQAQRLPLALTYWVLYDVNGEAEPFVENMEPESRQHPRNSEGEIGSCPSERPPFLSKSYASPFSETLPSSLTSRPIPASLGQPVNPRH